MVRKFISAPIPTPSAVVCDDLAAVKAIVHATNQGNAWTMVQALKELLDV